MNAKSSGTRTHIAEPSMVKPCGNDYETASGYGCQTTGYLVCERPREDIMNLNVVVSVSSDRTGVASFKKRHAPDERKIK